MNYVDQLINDDFVWERMKSALNLLKRKRSGKTISICCPMCTLRGETADRRFRCGITPNNPGIMVHCFNCDFATKYIQGTHLSKNFRAFLMGINIPDDEVKRLAYKANSIARMFQSTPEAMALIDVPNSMYFNERALPDGAKSFDALAHEGCSDSDFLDVVNYLYDRGAEVATSISYYWTPLMDNNLNRRVIIPYFHNDVLVGWTARAIDKNIAPKYFTNSDSDFMFNTEVLFRKDYKYLLVVEGIFDALAIQGLSAQGSHINERQMIWLESFGKSIVVVPDRDKTGQKMIDIALKRNWSVAFPALSKNHAGRNWWDSDVKDAAEAVKRYGRIYTTTSIIKTATNNTIEINMKRKALI